MIEDIERKNIICDSILKTLSSRGEDIKYTNLSKYTKQSVLSRLEIKDERVFSNYFMSAINTLEERNCIKITETLNSSGEIVRFIHITEKGIYASTFTSFAEYVKHSQVSEEKKQAAELANTRYNKYNYYIGLSGLILSIITFAISFFNNNINWFVYISAFLMGAICTNFWNKKI